MDNLSAVPGDRPDPRVNPTVAESMFDGHRAMCELEGNITIEFGHLGFDEYDNSLEIHDVPDDVRLDEASIAAIREAGFAVAYVNHQNKWETHYRFSSDPVKPWRVSYPHKRGEEGGRVLVEEFPAGWPQSAHATTTVVAATPAPTSQQSGEVIKSGSATDESVKEGA